MREPLTFAAPAIDFAAVGKTPDGAIILNAKAARSGDYEYFGFEVTPPEGRSIGLEDQLIGRIEPADLESVLPSFKGLPVTDTHIFVPVGERQEFAIGTLLNGATMDGEWAASEALIHDPKAILKITNGTAQELSIGFMAELDWTDGAAGEPDFYIRNIELNHVALVGEGRAGPEGRLSNHKAQLETINMPKIMIDGVEHEVPEAVAGEFTRLSNAEADLAAARTAQTAIERERDEARGQLAAASAEVTALQNSAPDIAAEATRMATEHAAFILNAKALGYEPELKLGEYDQTKVKAEIVNKRGANLPEDASAEMVNGAWTFAVAQIGTSEIKHSALDNIVPAHAVSASEGARDAIHNSYFGGKKKEA